MKKVVKMNDLEFEAELYKLYLRHLREELIRVIIGINEICEEPENVI